MQIPTWIVPVAMTLLGQLGISVWWASSEGEKVVQMETHLEVNDKRIDALDAETRLATERLIRLESLAHKQ